MTRGVDPPDPTDVQSEKIERHLPRPGVAAGAANAFLDTL